VVEFFSRLTWYFLIIIGVCINFSGFTSELCMFPKFLTDLLPTLTGETQEATYDFTFLTDYGNLAGLVILLFACCYCCKGDLKRQSLTSSFTLPRSSRHKSTIKFFSSRIYVLRIWFSSSNVISFFGIVSKSLTDLTLDSAKI
jgi:hypothetical protein